MVRDEDHGAVLDCDGDPLRRRLHALLLRLHVLPPLSERPDDHVLDGARLRAGDRVAYVGAGTGCSLALGAVERVGPDGDVLAIDASVDALEDLRARVQAPNVSYFIGRADVLPLMDDSVDAVLSCLALRSVDDTARAARELFRVLSSGGRVSICGEGVLEPVLTGAGFSDVRTEPSYLTAVKP